jgi:hypothetical protein
LENPKNCICLEIHDEVWTASKDAERAITGAGVGALAHGKSLSLQCVPWSATLHGIIGEIAYRVNGFSTDRVGLLMQERMK